MFVNEERPIQNMLSFDVEDWFHGLAYQTGDWHHYEDRLAEGLAVVLEILAEFKTKATFFILGPLAQSHPYLIQRIAKAGHEIGTHGWSHKPLYQQTALAIKTELYQSLHCLADITGQSIRGHRAAFFSITTQNQWALSLLAEMGLSYDSSIFPIYNRRYGIPQAPRFPYRLPSGLLELPISTLRLAGVNLPFSGGAYARLLPYRLIKWGIRRLNQQGQPAIVYFHPWEFDPHHPRLSGTVSPLYRFTHYYNLQSSANKLQALLKTFNFGPMGTALTSYQQKDMVWNKQHRLCLNE